MLHERLIFLQLGVIERQKLEIDERKNVMFRKFAMSYHHMLISSSLDKSETLFNNLSAYKAATGDRGLGTRSLRCH